MKRKIFKLVVAVILLATHQNLLAIEVDELTIPKDLAMGIKHHSYDYASIENGEPELAMDYTQVKLPLGKFEVLDQIMVPTLSIEKTDFSFDGFSQNSPDEKSLYTIKSSFMFIKKQDDKWMRILQITPSLHSDMDALDDDAFSLMGLAIWRYQSTPESAWTMGFGANRLFGEYKPIPLISYQYLPSSRLQLDLGFPITKAEYRWAQNWTGFTSLAPIGGNWRVDSEDKGELNVSYSSWVASSGIRYQLKPKMWATLEVAQGISRKLNLDDSDDQEEVDVDDSPAIMFSIGFHP